MAFETATPVPAGDEKSAAKKKKTKSLAQISQPKISKPKMPKQAEEAFTEEMEIQPEDIETILEVVEPPPLPKEAGKKIEPPPITKEMQEQMIQDKVRRDYQKHVESRRNAHEEFNRDFNCEKFVPERKVVAEQSFVAADDQNVFQLDYLAYTQEKIPDEKHPLNQDCALVDSESRMIAVFDGAGGAENGEKASRHAAKTFYEGFKEEKFQHFDSEQDFEQYKREYEKKLKSQAKKASKLVYIKAPRSGTTMAFAQVVGTKEGKMQVAVASIGDSPIYLMDKDKKIKQMNEDHNLISELAVMPKEKRDKILPRAAMDMAVKNKEIKIIRNKAGEKEFVQIMESLLDVHSPTEAIKLGLEKKYEGLTRDNILGVYVAMSNRITRSLGQQNLDPNQVDIKWMEMDPGDTLLVFSDSVSDNRTEKQLEKELNGNVKNLGKVTQNLQRDFNNKNLVDKRLVKPDDIAECALTVSLAA